MSIYRHPIMLRVTDEMKAWLRRQGNANEYIRKLIEADMQKNG